MADIQSAQFMPYQPNNDYSSESNSDPASPYSPPPRNTRRREYISPVIHRERGRSTERVRLLRSFSELRGESSRAPSRAPSIMRGRGHDGSFSNTRDRSFSRGPQPPRRRSVSHMRRRSPSDERSNRSFTPPPDLDDHTPSDIAAEVDAM